MTHFVHVDFPVQHPGVERAERVIEALGRTSLAGAALAVLAAVGTPVRAAAAAVAAGLASWRAARAQARADAQFWQFAQSDARVMADLSRAMSDTALRQARD